MIKKIKSFFNTVFKKHKTDSDEMETKNFYGQDESEIPGYTPDHIIFCDGLVKIYKSKDTEVVALQGLELEIKKGEMMAIIGNSGSGKSTLMNLIGGLDVPSAGTLIVDGENLLRMKKSELLRYKKEKVGFVWQNNARNLIPYLPAIHNVEIPMILAGRKDAKKRAAELLDLMGLKDRMKNRLSQLSGGEQQRVAIARALAKNPKLLLCDEPTGALDYETGRSILKLLQETCKEREITVVVITHNLALIPMGDQVIKVKSGLVDSIMENAHPVGIERIEW